MKKCKSGPIIWGGPLYRIVFHKSDFVFVKVFNRQGTILNEAVVHPGLQTMVPVQFESGKGLPGNDPVQMVPVSQLVHKKRN